nr:hypothetical protein VIGAN_01046000 [Ipomoea trifida]
MLTIERSMVSPPPKPPEDDGKGEHWILACNTIAADPNSLSDKSLKTRLDLPEVVLVEIEELVLIDVGHNCFAAAERRLLWRLWQLEGVLLENFRRVLEGRGEGVGYVRAATAACGGGRRDKAETGGFWEDRTELRLGAVQHNGGSVVGSGGVLRRGESAEPPPRPFLRLPDLRHPFPPTPLPHASILKLTIIRPASPLPAAPLSAALAARRGGGVTLEVGGVRGGGLRRSNGVVYVWIDFMMSGHRA